MAAARALVARLPAVLLAADSHQKFCWTKQPKTISLERTTTNIV